ncbi:DNA-directed RNA polymerases IV and V subunit 4-like [Vicia villosa]|uniref:DNA-directed RNA polymerases IV and V subunit 4-like n=1 Tax=Vicia villosa TaxID=3911 RepID=UPI00273BC583|nr:DNA-directed RNA polymerases IV and V subunit 4-like [Vicia villosa]XP_058728069.1 DNA-directed RNA polymerases IV and V subunit 4-like [Vicia villosa]
MSDKGGKAGSLLSKGSLKGKDDSATKSAKARKVQFAKEGPFESVLNGQKSGGKADFGRGKGDKFANGGKSSAAKDPHQFEHRVDQELPDNIKCLMDCEAAVLLQGIQDRMVSLSRDPAMKMPASFDKGLHYAKSSNKHSNPEFARLTLEPLLNHGLTESEICVISNAYPETADEVFALLPSLKGKRGINSLPIEESLSELAKFKQTM